MESELVSGFTEELEIQHQKVLSLQNMLLKGAYWEKRRDFGDKLREMKKGGGEAIVKEQKGQ